MIIKLKKLTLVCFLSGLIFSIISAHAENGVSKNQILIGSSLALEGHASYLGSQTMTGAKSYINHINDSGGIFGRKIKVVAYNDGYEPKLCIDNTNKLIKEDKVFALACYVGTPTSVKIIPIVENLKVPLVGLFTGAEALRSPLKRYIFNIRASYYEETGGIVEHFWKDLGVRKIAVFYQNDAFGKAGLEGVRRALKKFNAKPVGLGTYERGSSDIMKGLTEIRKSDPEAVVMIGVYGPCANFIRAAKWSGFDPYFHNVSFVGAKQMAYLLGVGRDSEGVIVTQVVPPPESSHKGVVEYRALLKKYFPKEKPNFVSLEGFVNAKVLVEILKRCGENLTRDRFIKEAESLKKFDVGLSSMIDYSPNDHRGLSEVYFSIIKNGKYELINNWSEIKLLKK